MDTVTNFARALIVTPPTPATSGDTFTVETGLGSRFPLSNFQLVLRPHDADPTPENAEIVRCISRTGDTFTVIRAQEETTAKEIQTNWVVALDITAKMIDDIRLSGIGGGGYSAPLYFTNKDSDVSGYKQIEYTFEPTLTELSGSVTNEEKLLRTYLYPLAISRTVIDAGLWVAGFNVKVDKATGVTQLKFEAFLRHSDDTETTLFSAYSTEINNTDYELIRNESAQGAFSCLTTDRFGCRIYAKTTSLAEVIISTTVGDGNASYISTPAALRHSLTVGRDEENCHPASAISYGVSDVDTELDRLANTSGTNTGDQESSDFTHDALDGVNLAAEGVNLGHISAGEQTIAGVKTFSSQVVSTVATGVAAMVIASTTLISNLNADLLDGQHGSYYTDASHLTSLSSISHTSLSNIGTNTHAQIDTFMASKGNANGLATLDSGGKIPTTQLPNSIMEYMGTWDASTNTPTLTDGTAANAGNVYRCTVAGTVDFGSGDITFGVGDYAVCNHLGTWEKSDTTDSVVSVNGYTGIVTLTQDDIGNGTTYKQTHNDFTDTYKGYLNQAVTTTSSPTLNDLTISNPVNIYSLSHDSFADYVANEHIDWTNASANLKTSGSITGNYTAGSILFAGTSGVLSQDNANFYWDDTEKRLAIGGQYFADTLAPFAVNKDGGAAYLDFVAFRDEVSGGGLRIYHARGSLATPTALLDNDYLGMVEFKGYDGSAWQTAARVIGYVDGTVGSGEVGGRLEFRTKQPTDASLVTKMWLHGSGNLALITDSDSYPLSIQGSGGAVFAIYNVYNTTDDSTQTHGGVSGMFNYNGTSDTAGSYSGGYFDARYSGSTNNTNGTGLRGFTGAARFLGTGTLKGALGVYGALISSGGGVITSGYTLYAGFPSLTNGSTITNLYGCYISTQATTGVANPWGLYQVSSLDLNYLAGDIRVGDNSGGSKFNVRETYTATTPRTLVTLYQKYQPSGNVGTIYPTVMTLEPHFNLNYTIAGGILTAFRNFVYDEGSTIMPNIWMQDLWYTQTGSATGSTSVTYLYMRAPSITGSGVISYATGIYITDFSAGNVNRGIYSAISAGSNKWNLYIDGTADSYFAGNVGIGRTTPTAKLHIDQASTTGAIPVLTLDQADLSEEFINFVSTVGTGYPIDTAAIGTYYGKIRVQVEGVGYKYMALYNS